MIESGIILSTAGMMCLLLVKYILARQPAHVPVIIRK